MVASFSYDDGGRRVGRTLGDTPGTVTTTTYGRADNLPTAIADNRGIVSFGYTYDANKNKLSETLASPMAAYGFGTTTPCTYDNEDRLTAWHQDNGLKNLSWSLSNAGDWNSYTQNAYTQYRTHNAVHEITNSPYLHDAKGNMTKYGVQVYNTYEWDFDNRLTRACNRFSTVALFTYDALGRRVSKIVTGGGGDNGETVFVSSIMPLAHSPHAGQEVAEYAVNAEPASPIRKYVYADYIDEPVMMVNVSGKNETKYYYHANNIYSVAALTKQDGSVQIRYAYDAYGRNTWIGTDVGNRYFFTGRRYDVCNDIYYYRARYYHPTLGRFLGRDPIGYDGGVNLYEYVGSDPLLRMDASGLWDYSDPVLILQR